MTERLIRSLHSIWYCALPKSNIFVIRVHLFGGAMSIINKFSYGGAAAIVSGLLIFGIADNLTDSLSLHIYMEVD